jgi:hypothetical protein
MSFIKMAMEASEKAFDATQSAAEEWNAHRHASNLLLKLGIAVYAEQRLGGTHDAVERILAALDGHAAEYQEVGLDHLHAAHDVLGKEFIEPRHDSTVASVAASTSPAAPAQPTAQPATEQAQPST